MSYDSVVLADAPLHYYKQNETSGTSAIDYGSLTSNGTINGGVTLNQAAIAPGLGASMLFNGSTGYISVPVSGLPTGASAWSMEVWISLPTLTQASTYNTVMGFGTQTSNEWVELDFQGGAGPRFDVYSWAAQLFNSTGLLTPVANTSYHFVITYDGTTMTVYGNGARLGSAFTTTLNIVSGLAYIGAEGASAQNIHASISNTAWYGSALSSSRVSAHYNAGITASTSIAKFIGNHRSFARIR